MKTLRILGIGFMACTLMACEKEMEQDVNMNIRVSPSEGLSYSGDTVIVKAGTALNFNIQGDPDVITFFSGERGHEYKYRNRTEVATEDIASSVLQFSVWLQHGNRTTAANLFKMYVSDSFEGLKKDDFKADSTSAVNHAWKDLVAQAELPQSPVKDVKGAKEFSIDMSQYLSKKISLAIVYQGKDNSAAQPRVNFVGMKLVNTMKNGSVTTLMASDFNFTPLNMDNGQNKKYATVTNNTSGVWNIKESTLGNFFCHSTGKDNPLKYSWIISDGIKSNTCSPDAGVSIKALGEVLNRYSYIYNKVGVYTATFYAANGNYKQYKSLIREVTVKVVQ